jgi:hypothetical protein
MLRASDPLPHYRVAGGDVRIANTEGERGVAEEVVAYIDRGGRLAAGIPARMPEGDGEGYREEREKYEKLPRHGLTSFATSHDTTPTIAWFGPGGE